MIDKAEPASGYRRVAKMNDNFQLFARLGNSYKARFLLPTWRRCAPEKDGWNALAMFLEHYGFERQGARPDYKHAARDAVMECKQAGHSLTDSDIGQYVWTWFKQLLGSKNLNEGRNPLCPKGTLYQTKRGSDQTGKLSAIEWFSSLAQSGAIPNIVLFMKMKMDTDEVNEGFTLLCGSGGINGIGPKIASLFLRDIAIFYGLIPKRDRYRLQPVDVWVRRISMALMGRKASDMEIAHWIVKECQSMNIGAEAVNDGMWYFGSQIAASAYRLDRAVKDLGYAKALVNEHTETLRQAASSLTKPSIKTPI
jgi:hypothetical protein